MQIGAAPARDHHTIDDLAPSNIHKSAHDLRKIKDTQKSVHNLCDWFVVVDVALLNMTRVSVIARHGRTDTRSAGNQIATKRAMWDITPAAAKGRNIRAQATLLPAVRRRIGRDLSVVAYAAVAGH